MIDFNDKSWINYVDEQVWKNLPDGLLKTRNSSEITFRCPICGDSKKNRTKKRGYFYRKTGTYHCFNCEANLTGLAFLKVICTKEVYDSIIQDYKVLNFNKVVNKGRNGICDSTSSHHVNSGGIDILSPSPSYKYLLDLKWKETKLSDKALGYLDGRMIPIGNRDMLSSIYDEDGNEYILIKYIWDDKTIYHQLANFNKYDIVGQGAVKYIFPKESSINFQDKPVFNLNKIDVSFPYVICCEGIFDSLFVKNGVALGGRNLTDYQYKMIREFYPRHKIVLAFDNDRAGFQSALKYSEKRPDVYFLDDYDILNAAKVKDINDFVKVTKRIDLFSSGDILKKLIISPFKLEMKLKLKGLK